MKQVRMDDDRSPPPPPSSTGTTTGTGTTTTSRTRRWIGVAASSSPMSSPPLTIRESIQLQCRYFGTGVWDSVQAWPHSLLVLYSSPTVRSLASRCLLLNGVIFLGSLALFHGTIGPVLQWWARALGIVVAGTSVDPTGAMSWTEVVLRLCYQVSCTFRYAVLCVVSDLRDLVAHSPADPYSPSVPPSKSCSGCGRCTCSLFS